MVDQTHQAPSKFYGWINVIFLFFLYSMMMGFVFYGFAVIFPAMITAEGWGRAEASLAHTIRGLATGFLAPFAAFCIAKMGQKKTLAIGLLVSTISLSLLGTVTTQLWQWTLIWGLMMPMAFSLGGLLPIQTTVAFWFNKKRATALGIVMTGAAAAATVAAPLYTYIIKQTGTWQTGWLVAAGLCAVGVVLTFFLKNTPQSVGQFPDGIDPSTPVTEEISGKQKAIGVFQTQETWTLKEAIRTRVVWLQLLCMVGQGWALYMITTHIVLHFVDQSFTPMDAAKFMANFFLFSGIARFPIGVLADRIEPRKLSAFALLGMTIATACIWKAPQNVPFLLCVFAVYGFSFGATVITFPMITANYFGPQAFAPINGFLAPIMIPITAPVPFLAGLIFDHYKSYDMAFIPIIIMSLVAAICAWFLYPPKKKEAVTE